MSKLNQIKFTLIDLIVLFSYYFFCLFLVLAIFGCFNRLLIILGLIPLLIFLIIFRKQIIFPKRYLAFFILIPLICLGLLLFFGRYSGDALYYWLPLVREIVLQGEIPELFMNSATCFTDRMPLMPLFFAGVFSFFGLSPFFVSILIFFFVAATTCLLYQWVKEKGISQEYIFFIILLLLTSPIFLKYGWTLHQEAFVLFFGTAFFYYLEKYQQRNNGFDFLLLVFSFVLAIASKFIAIILVLPLAWLVIKDKLFKEIPTSIFLISLPVIFWFIRNYLIYGNPFFFPIINEIFGGEYLYLIHKVGESSKYAREIISANETPLMGSYILTGIISFFKSLWIFCPVFILSIYGFWKQRKIQYLLLILLFFIATCFVLNKFFFIDPYPRYWYILLGLLLVYSLVGLTYIKSRIFLSLLFSFNLFGLLNTKLYLSQSKFIAPLEGYFNLFYQASQFIYEYKLIFAMLLGIFFYFLIAHQKYSKYLLLLLFCSYLVKTSSIQLSWLNIWLPILFLILLTIIWRFFINLKEGVLRKLIITYIIILLILNSWGLTSLYYIFHEKFTFPRIEEFYGVLPAAAKEIKQIEGENKDFYIYVAFPHYLTWYHNYKVVTKDNYTFHLITNLEYQENIDSLELHRLFKRSNIKYIIENSHRTFWENFFNKIKSRPDLFKVILEKDGYYLWRVYE